MGKANTTVDGFELCRAWFAQRDDASAAIAFVAAFFRAAQVQIFAKELQERARGWYILYFTALPPVQKSKWFDVHAKRVAPKQPHNIQAGI